MKLVKSLLTAGLAIGLLTGCALDKSAIIKVNDEAITKADYEKVLNRQIKNPQFKQQAGDAVKNPNSFIMLITKDRIVNELIVKKILEQQVKKHDIKVSAEDLKKQKEDIYSKVGGEDRLKQLLKDNGVSEAQFKEDITNEIQINKLVEAIADTKVSDKDIKEFYEKNKKSFDRPETVKASHILIKANPDEIRQNIIDADKNGKLTAVQIDEKVKAEMDKKMELAKKVREEVAKNPEKFAELAKKYSEDEGTAVRGGDLGYFPKEAMVKPFADAAFSLKPNTISEVVVTQFGNHIIIVTDRAAKGLQPLDKVKDEISAFLEQQKKITSLQNLFEGLKASAKVEYVNPEFDPKNIQVEVQKAIQQQSAGANAQ